MSKELLAGYRCQYLIGTDTPGMGVENALTVVGIDIDRPVQQGRSAGYVNLLVEVYDHDTREPARYRPYLKPKGTAAEYGEGIPDPKGDGWSLNLTDQLKRRAEQGFTLVELDNPDTYTLATMQRAYTLARGYGLQVIAKNPELGCSLTEGDSDSERREILIELLADPVCVGCIVEQNAGTPKGMHELRQQAGRLLLPVFFVAHSAEGLGRCKRWVSGIAEQIHNYEEMSVSYDGAGTEYEQSMTW